MENHNYKILQLEFKFAMNASDVSVDGLLIEQRKLIDKIENLKFEIYPNDHNPPHFHVISNEFNCSFRIEDGTQLEGPKLNGKLIKKISYFWKNNKENIINCWNELIPTISQKNSLT